MNYVLVPAMVRGEFFLLSSVCSFLHQDYFPPSDAFDEATAAEHSPHFRDLIDLCDVPSLKEITMYDSIYFVRQEGVDRFPAGLYRTSVLCCIGPR